MGKNVTVELLDKIDNYLKDNMSIEKRFEFESEINADNELKEIVLIQKELFEFHNFQIKQNIIDTNSSKGIQHYKEQLNDEENQKLFSKIKEIGQNNLNQKVVSSKNFFKYCVAASITLLISTILFFYSNSSLENYYKNNVNWEELPSYIDKGEESINDFTKGEIFFRNNEYEKAIGTFTKISSKNKLYPYSIMYLGASYEQLDENEKALEAFDKLLKLKNFEESSRGYWYKLLIYMKLNDKEKASEMKSIIVGNTNNFNYAKAKQIKI